MIVVDASVAVKWFVPEEDEKAAQSLLTGALRLVAPALIKVEVTAALVRKARLNQVSHEDIRSALALWFQALTDGVIVSVPDKDDLAAAAELALALGHPVQDCLYLAVAERLGVPIVTADRKFASRASATHAGVQLLNDIR